MKINYALILAAGLSSGLVVQPVYSADEPAPAQVVPPAPIVDVRAPADSNKLEAAPAPLIPAAPAAKKSAPAAKKAAAPAKKPKTKEVKAKPAEPLAPAAPLSAGPAMARQDNVNIRGQAAINSEVVTKLKKGQQVTVLEEITKKPKLDEPAKWAKIKLPSGTVVWVHSSFIDPATKTVKPKKLNLRSGPGENYSVIGTIEKGTTIKEIESKGDWIKIEAPADAYGFVAAHLLLNAPAEAAKPPMIASTEPPKTPETPATPPTVVAPPTPPIEVAVVTPTPPPVATTPPTVVAPITPPAPATPPPAEVATTPAPIPATAPAKPEEEEKEEPLIKRVISREGIVKRSVSIQAPSFFALQSLENGKTVNYLHATSTNLVLKDFWNQRVVVTGEEQLDERWPNTPVIYVDSLQPVQ